MFSEHGMFLHETQSWEQMVVLCGLEHKGKEGKILQIRMPGPFDILKIKVTALNPTQAHSKIHH